MRSYFSPIANLAITFCLLCACQLPEVEFDGPPDSAEPADGGTYVSKPRADSETTLEIGDVRIAEDTNSDGVLSPGESALVVVQIRNTSNRTAASVSGLVTTTQVGVTMPDGTKLYFGDLAGGETACGVTQQSVGGTCSSGYVTYYLKVEVASSVTVGTSVDFKLSLSDRDATRFDLTFSLKLAAIAQELSVSAADSVAETNGDGVVSPGEAALLRVQIANGGMSHALGLVGIVSTAQTGVTLPEGSKLYFGDVGSGDTACGVIQQSVGGSCSSGYQTYFLKVQVANNVPVGTKVEFKLALSDQYANRFELSFSLTLAAIAQEFFISALDSVGDTNEDGTVSPGEVVLTRIQLGNRGTSLALGVVGTVSTQHTGITFPQGAKLYFGDIGSGEVACGVLQESVGGLGSSGYQTYYLQIQVDSSVPAGLKIDLNLDISDAFKNSYREAFSMTLGSQ